MTCRTDVADGISYRFCPDDPPVEADRLRSVVRWTAIDEITNVAPNVDFSLTTSVNGLSARVAGDGVMGLVGNPARLFPGLGGSTVDLPFSLSAPGYVPRSFNPTLGPVAGFPNAFAPLDLGVVALHRRSIVLRGRIVQRTGLAPTPLSGVDVRLAGVWSTFPAPEVDPDTVIEAPNLASLHPGLYVDRKTGVDGAQRRVMTLASGEEKKLLLPAVAGDTSVRLSDCVNLVAGNVLAFEADDVERVEYIAVEAVHPASSTDQPATIDLVHPLAVAHEQGASCVRATPGGSAATDVFTRDGIVGDGVAFLDTLTDLVEGAVVEIGGSPPPVAVEYQTVRLFATTTDADGFYRLPPIARVASVKLHAERFDLMPPQEPVRSPDYGRYENFVDVFFP